MNPATVNSEVAQARSQGQALQNQYNTQATQLQGQYGQAYSQANDSQAQLQGYANQIAGKNYGDIYGQDLASAQQMYGFDPKQLLIANKNLANTQTTLANLPQAVQQQGNYYGTTAGQQAGNYANMAGGLNTVLAGQGNAVNAYQNVLAATQQQANQQTTQQLAGQGQALSAYQQAASNAASIMQSAGQTMAQIEQLQQQQGYATAQQVAAYQNAYSQYVSAQASMVAAQGAAAQNYSQANINNLQGQQMKNYMNSSAYKNALGQGGGGTIGTNGNVAQFSLPSGGLQGSSPQGGGIKLQ